MRASSSLDWLYMQPPAGGRPKQQQQQQPRRTRMQRPGPPGKGDPAVQAQLSFLKSNEPDPHLPHSPRRPLYLLTPSSRYGTALGKLKKYETQSTPWAAPRTTIAVGTASRYA